LALASAAPAAPAVLTAVTELSAEAVYAKYPAVAHDAAGRLWVAWTATVEGHDQIHARRLGDNGWLPAERLDDGEGLASGALLTRDGQGTLWAIWHGLRDGRWRILGRPRGAEGWEPERLLSPPGSDALHPAAALAGDVLWLAWEIAVPAADKTPGGFAIELRSLVEGSLSPPGRIATTGSDRRPQLAACADGRAYVAWDSTRDGNFDIFLARLTDSGSPTASELLPITRDEAIDDTPSLACSPAGDLWIAWSSTRGRKDAALRTDRHSGDAFVRVLRNGALLSPPGVAPGTLPGQVSHGMTNKTPRDAVQPYWHWKQTQNYPRVFHDRRGAWVVWRTDATGAHDFDLFGRYHVGDAWSAEINLTPFSPGRDEWPTATTGGDGELLLAWEGQLLPTAERRQRFGGGDVDAYNSKASPNVILTGRLRPPAAGKAGSAPLLPAPPEPIGARADSEPAFAGPARGTARAGDGRWTIWFGDPHSHSILSDAKTGWPDQLLLLARDRLEIDYAVVSDHAEMGILQPSEWAELQLTARTLDQPGRFGALSGWEWTDGTGRAGHRVAVFADDGHTPLSSDRPEGDSIEELYEHLRAHRAVLSPHHTGNATWGRWNPDAHHDETLEPNFEIASWHGRYEFYGNPWEGRRQIPGHQYQDTLRRGRHVGVMAASDTHHLTPGEGGLTAVLAERLDRESLFEALRSRRNYATTGARIVLEFTANGAPMGSILEAREEVELMVRVEGTAAVDRIEIVRDLVDTFAAVRIEQDPNGPAGVFMLHRPPDDSAARSVEDTRRLTFSVRDRPAATGETSYYVRVTQQDGHQAWSSPIWIAAPR
jgi:hypothetical protein